MKMSKALKGIIIGIAFVVLVVVAVLVFAWGGYNSAVKTISTCDMVYITNGNDKAQMQNDDVENLKALFVEAKGKRIGEPSCGFGENCSLELVNAESGESIVIYPAQDKCNIFRIDGVYYELPQETRVNFESLVEKYGLTFPNI
jgi:hypothetical protein